MHIKRAKYKKKYYLYLHNEKNLKLKSHLLIFYVAYVMVNDNKYIIRHIR